MNITVSLVQELVRISSITGNDYKALQQILKTLEGLGFDVEIVFPTTAELRKLPNYRPLIKSNGKLHSGPRQSQPSLALLSYKHK